MASSGIEVEESCKQVWIEMKKHSKYTYVIFRISEDLKEIILDETSKPKGNKFSPEEEFEEFQTFRSVMEHHHEEKQCRFAIFHFNYDLGESGKRSKSVFIRWCPDVAHIRMKMLYTTSQGSLLGSFKDEIALKLQANDLSDLDYNDIISELKYLKS